ncbi:MAG TPA: hypothetical protein VGU20_01625 [Stellaceae bacterium]|nr:hypothetical protein [Stellaceae bacterium]
MSQHTYNNLGTFHGPVFQGSTINNAGQIAGTLAGATPASREALQALLQQLGEGLKTVPPEKMDDANATAASAEDLLKEAGKPTPNKSRLRLLGDALLGGARALGSAAPTVISTAQGIVDLIAKIHALG